MDENAFLIQKQIQWCGSLMIFDRQTILKAVDRCQEIYDKPPSIKEFIALCRSERDRYKFGAPQLEDRSKKPSSLLLNEYMINHPVDEKSDSFKKIFDQFGGKKRGIETIKEIKRQLGGKTPDKQKL